MTDFARADNAMEMCGNAAAVCLTDEDFDVVLLTRETCILETKTAPGREPPRIALFYMDECDILPGVQRPAKKLKPKEQIGRPGGTQMLAHRVSASAEGNFPPDNSGRPFKLHLPEEVCRSVRANELFLEIVVGRKMPARISPAMVEKLKADRRKEQRLSRPQARVCNYDVGGVK